jgi:hypothetical protein
MWFHRPRTRRRIGWPPSGGIVTVALTSEPSEQFAMVSLEGPSLGTETLRANTPYLSHQLSVGDYRKQGFMGTPI